MTLGLAPKGSTRSGRLLRAFCLAPFLEEVYVHSAQKAAPYLHFNIDLATSSLLSSGRKTYNTRHLSNQFPALSDPGKLTPATQRVVWLQMTSSHVSFLFDFGRRFTFLIKFCLEKQSKIPALYFLRDLNIITEIRTCQLRD